MYFDDKDLKKEVNKIKLDNDNSSNNFEEKILDDSNLYNNNGYNGYNGYNEYGSYNKDYYYHDKRYKRKSSLIISPIISLITI